MADHCGDKALSFWTTEILELEIGRAGLPAVTLMRRDLDLASKAMIEGDLPAMVHIYEELKGWQL